MTPRIRIVLGVVLAAGIAALAVSLLVRNATPPGESRLEGLIARFMLCLPEETSDAGREEVRGIMTRFCNRAVVGKVHPQDIVEIESDLEAYIGRGEIPKSELFDFMSKIGNATRRMDPGSQPPED